MVTIRKLQPTVQISMPRRTTKRPSQQVHVERRRVNFPPPTPQPTPCVLWQGSVDRDGYGRFKRQVGDHRETVRVIRWVMSEVLGRQLRPHEFVMHACDNPPCYRVDHLSVGTVQDNNRDMLLKGRAVKPPVNRFYGECHPMAKLSERQVRAIRGHWVSGLRMSTIAEMFEVSPNTIRKIVRGITWATGSSQQGIVPGSGESMASPEPTRRVKRKGPNDDLQELPLRTSSSGKRAVP